MIPNSIISTKITGLFRTDRRRVQPAKASLDEFFIVWMSSDAEVIYTYVVAHCFQDYCKLTRELTLGTTRHEAAAYSTPPQLFTAFSFRSRRDACWL